MALLDSLQSCLEVWVSLQPIIQDQDLVSFSFLDHQTGHAARFNAQGLLYECVFNALLFFYVASTFWKYTSF